MTDRTKTFENEPVVKAVLKQIAPATAAQMTALLYNLADTWFVGLLNDPRQTAAATVVYPSFIMLTAISNLFGVGGAAALARALGRKEPDEAGNISAVSFWFGLIVSLVFAGVYTVFLDPVLTLCGATAETLPFCRGYALTAISLGGVFTALSMLMSNLVRAEGASFAASFGLSAGGILNIILDPFFILPRFLGMGVAGAGLATAVSNAAAAVLFLVLILRKGSVLSLSIKRLRPGLGRLGEVLKTGLPSAAQFLLTVVAIAAQARFVSKYPTAAVAGLGITKKLDQLPINFAIGVATGLLPLLAYNHAAGNEDRLKKCFRLGTGIALGFALLCLAAYEAFAPELARFFIKDKETVGYAAAFLRRMVVAMPLMSVCYPIIIRFQAEGRVTASLVCSILRKGVIDVPLLFLTDAIEPLYGLMWVQPIVDGIALTAALLMLRNRRKAFAKKDGL
ncbi:MAG: MATE family efflux transporter [Clostridia bacterium]|nr:MATE family efflux transporter [Clostridia bacterium]